MCVDAAPETEYWFSTFLYVFVEEIVELLAAESVINPILLFLWIVFNTHHLSFFWCWVEVVKLVIPFWELGNVLRTLYLLLTSENVVSSFIGVESARPNHEVVVS